MSRQRAVKASKRSNIIQIERALIANERAVREGPKRKTWSKHDLRSITAATPPQREMIRDFIEGQNIVAVGSAGTGKTFIALYLALDELLTPESDIDKIVIVRSAVPTRDMGFTPGTAEEKAALYEDPYTALFAELMGRQSTYADMKEAGKVAFATTSYLRGVTWDNALVVVDECQSMTFHEINTIMTRLGKQSRIILCGDMVQNDLTKKNDTSGMAQALACTARMRAFSNVTFTRDDIVRSDFVKQWIIAVEDETGS